MRPGLLVLLLLSCCTAFLHAQSPLPFIQQPLQPSAISPGSPDFTLTVRGSGFVSGAVVKWKGQNLATTFVSLTEVTAAVPASKITTAGVANVNVVNPAGARSNDAYLEVSIPASGTFSQNLQPTNDRTNRAVSGDFNADGKLDVALLGQSGTMSVFLGRGDGTFQRPTDYSIGTGYIFSLVTGDFNKDGKLDLAATFGLQPGMVAVLLGAGDGTFSSAQNFAVSNFPIDMLVGDFNRDGKLDVLTLCLADEISSGKLSLLLGNGDGTFASHRDSAAISNPQKFAVGDFNVDGNLDVVVAGGKLSSSMNLFTGNGDGTFLGPASFPLSQDNTTVVAADLNGDGLPDLAGTAFTSNANGVVVLLNQGNGNFGAPVLYATPPFSNPVSVIAGDVDANGTVDLVTADDFDALGLGSISVLRGNGDGTFQVHQETQLRGIAPLGMVLGDFNRDGKPDLVVSYSEANKLSTLRGQ